MKRSEHIKSAILILILCILTCTACVKRDNSNTSGNKTTAAETESQTGTENVRYNTQDTVILIGVESDKSQISVQSISNPGKIYILNYSSGTSIKNKYDSEILINQVEKGEIIDVYYVAGTQKLIAMQESKQAWENDNVTNWNMEYDEKLMSIGGINYKYDDNTFIFSGKKEIDIENISGVDTLVVRGIDKQIYSMVVKTGHGYIKLADTKNFVGGMVDVGGKIMTVITEDMVIVAPEGEYTLTASKNGKGGSATVKVERDDEVTVSLSGFQGEVDKNGALKLNIKPDGVEADVFVDGVKVDITEVVDLSYGVHKLRIASDSYDDYVETITISSIYMNKTIDLSNQAQTSTEQTTASSETATTESSVMAADNKVTISKPEGASLYLDGVFKGTIPLTMTKEAGEHTVVLRKTGCESVVYTVDFSDDKYNVSLSFPEMEKSN